MKPRTKIKMIRLPLPFSYETKAHLLWNTWNIGDVGYIEGVLSDPIAFLVIVLGNKIIVCNFDAVEVIED